MGNVSPKKPSDTITACASPTRLRISFCAVIIADSWGCVLDFKMGHGSRLLGLYHQLHCTCIGHYTLERDGFADLVDDGNGLHGRGQVLA